MMTAKLSFISLLVLASVASGASEQAVADFAPLDIRRVERVYLDGACRESAQQRHAR